jgi:hypothetical protein
VCLFNIAFWYRYIIKCKFFLSPKWLCYRLFENEFKFETYFFYYIIVTNSYYVNLEAEVTDYLLRQEDGKTYLETIDFAIFAIWAKMAQMKSVTNIIMSYVMSCGAITTYNPNTYSPFEFGGHRGRERKVNGFTTTCAINIYHH